MDGALVDQVRRFNRTVTQRVGALNDEYLSRGRPLGHARVLWEIGPDGDEVRELRARLDLDSGYLSRLLRALEAESLIAVEPDDDDARVRRIRLTSAGLAERAELDRLSDELAASILAPLNRDQRERLVSAMAEVERLLVASMVDVDVVDPRHPYAQHCIQAYFDELSDRFDDGFDPARSISADEGELTPPDGLLLVATLHAQPVGCGALKFHDGGWAEVKRMWVSPDVRGLGLGRRLLAELEGRASSYQIRTLRLETNRALREAIGLYMAAGYVEVEPFNNEPYADHWFQKSIDSATSA